MSACQASIEIVDVDYSASVGSGYRAYHWRVTVVGSMYNSGRALFRISWLDRQGTLQERENTHTWNIIGSNSREYSDSFQLFDGERLTSILVVPESVECFATD